MVRPLPGTAMSLMSTPIRFDGERLPFRSAPPALGAHTDEILQPLPAEAKP
jgi:crotonobetainyl-CoA:carnitine CoA-transferase CaiB-like acyl-CoA transferase